MIIQFVPQAIHPKLLITLHAMKYFGFKFSSALQNKNTICSSTIITFERVVLSKIKSLSYHILIQTYRFTCRILYIYIYIIFYLLSKYIDLMHMLNYMNRRPTRPKIGKHIVHMTIHAHFFRGKPRTQAGTKE